MAPPRIELEDARDFTGGLNLQADPYQLAPNETFDLANVDIGRRGGFGIRRGIRPWVDNIIGFSGVPPQDATTFCTYVDPTNVRHLLAAKDSHTRRWTGASWQDVRAAIASSSDTSFAQMNGTLYFCNLAGAGGTQKWTGVGLSTAIPAPGFNDNLAAPVGNTFPQSAFLAVHKEVMWSAWGERVRWSHPGSAEDWRTNDWIDVGKGGEGSWVRAMVPFRDGLLVFKKKGIYVIQGSPPDGFSMEPISTELGVERPTAVATAADAVYFWDAKTGLWKYDGAKLEYVFEKVYPILDDQMADVTQSHLVRIARHRRRIFIAIPWAADPWGGKNITLVYAPDVGKSGAWTIHDTPCKAFHVHTQSLGADHQLLGANDGRVFEYDVENLYEDELTPGVTSLIKASYTTRWFDDRNPKMRKRWKRPLIVARGGANTTVYVDVFNDYDPTHVHKQFQLNTTLVGDELVWDVDNWDEANWATEVGDSSVILKGSTLGIGTAKALRFSNGTNDVLKGQNWRIHGLTMAWVPKRIRN